MSVPATRGVIYCAVRHPLYCPPGANGHRPFTSMPMCCLCVRSRRSGHRYQSQPIALAVDRVPTIAQCDHIDPSERTYTLQQCPGEFPQYNSGVIVWQRSAAILNLFAAWKQEWLRFKQHDQLALARALYATRQPVSVLHELDNFPVSRVTSAVIEQNQVRLLHCLGGFIACGRFHALAARLAPQPTALAHRILGGE